MGEILPRFPGFADTTPPPTRLRREPSPVIGRGQKLCSFRPLRLVEPAANGPRKAPFSRFRGKGRGRGLAVRHYLRRSTSALTVGMRPLLSSAGIGFDLRTGAALRAGPRPRGAPMQLIANISLPYCATKSQRELRPGPTDWSAQANLATHSGIHPDTLSESVNGRLGVERAEEVRERCGRDSAHDLPPAHCHSRLDP